MTEASDPPSTTRRPPQKHNRASDASEPQMASDACEPLSHGAIKAPDAFEEAAFAGRVTTLQEAVQFGACYGVSRDCMFHVARAIKTFAIRNQAQLALTELDGALGLWWKLNEPRLPADAQFDEFLLCLTDAYVRVRVPFGSNPLEVAIAKATPLSDKPTLQQRIDRLLEVCQHLQTDAGNEPFFIALRDVGRVICTSDPYMAGKVMTMLVNSRRLMIAVKGKPGSPKATRYRLKA